MIYFRCLRKRGPRRKIKMLHNQIDRVNMSHTFGSNPLFLNYFAGWSSPVARQAHNLKVPSSNLGPATNLLYQKPLSIETRVFVLLEKIGKSLVLRTKQGTQP